jgi:hypothetical protein
VTSTKQLPGARETSAPLLLANLAHATLAGTLQAIRSKRKPASDSTWLPRLGSFESTTLPDAECRSLTRAVANLDAGDVPEAAGVGPQAASLAVALNLQEHGRRSQPANHQRGGYHREGNHPRRTLGEPALGRARRGAGQAGSGS